MKTILPQVYVGVDISKNFFDVHVYPLEKAFRCTNNAKGMKKFLEELAIYDVKQVVCEASGGYESLMIKDLTKENYSTWIVEPKRIRAFIISEGINVKTDKIDACMIALLASQKRSKYESMHRSDTEEHLFALSQRRQDLVAIVTQDKNRLSHPKEVYCREKISELIAFLEDQIAQIDAEAAELIARSDSLQNKAAIIESVPGVGQVTTLALISGMPELGSLSSKQVASLLGVAPVIRQSGNSRGTAAIKGGRSFLRSIVYMAALSAIRFNPPLRAFYLRLRDAGKKPKVAIVAVMRKLIIIFNSMVKKGEVWRST